MIERWRRGRRDVIRQVLDEEMATAGRQLRLPEPELPVSLAAAESIGVSRSTLYRRMQRQGIVAPNAADVMAVQRTTH